MAAYEVLLLNTAIPQIQAAQAGDTYVVPRDIAFSAALTLSAGTANGVPYLNASKVLTTGSALTFDGTKLGVASGNIDVVSASFVGSPLIAARFNASNFRMGIGIGNSNGFPFLGANVNNAANDNGTFDINGYASRIRLDNGVFQVQTSSASGTAGNAITWTTPLYLDSSGNLGVGATLPGARLDLAGTASGVSNNFRLTSFSFQNAFMLLNQPNNGNYRSFEFQEAGSTTGYLRQYGSAYGTSLDSIIELGNGSSTLRFNSSGNLGLGITPSAWSSLAGGAFQNGGNGALWSQGTDELYVSQNVFFNGASRYVETRAASAYQQSSGNHRWYNAPSGTAGNAITFTQAMTLDASGNLGIGQTSPSYKLDVSGIVRISNGGDSYFGFGANKDNYFTTGTTSGKQVWRNATGTEYMTLDASGNLLVGDTSTNDNATLVVRRAGATVGATTYTLGWFQNATGYENGLAIKATDNAVTIAADFAGNTGGAAALVFATNSTSTANNATERARITSGGDFQTSSGNSVMVGGTAARATTAGTNRVDIFDGTAPVGTLANGVSFYSASGEANVMDAAGNATLLSPHDAETNEWIFRSKHTPTGKVLKIDVERLLKFVNDHFGLDAVHEFVEK